MTAAPAMNVVPIRPSPDRVEELAKEYKSLQKDYDEAKAKLDAIGDKLDGKAEDLRELVRNFGSAYAKKSKLLYGVTQEIMVTYGGSTSIDAAAVENFRLALKKAKQTILLKAIFEKTIRWTFQPQAGEIIRGSKLSDRLLGLAMKCEVYTPRTPTVTVRAKA